MTTLLLTFFVMLLSLADVRDEELFGKGRKSFIQALEGFGLGMLQGRKEMLDFGNIKTKYFIKYPDRLFEGRSIDAMEEDVRRIFKDLSQSVKSSPSRMAAKKADFTVTSIRFPPGDATLNRAARRFLTQFGRDLEQARDSKAVGLYVLGLAQDGATEKERWILSARRAQAVARVLKDTWGHRWLVYSWGAGPGGDWVEEDSPVSSRSQILIAILRVGE
jgi:hypothetical protein